VSLLWSTTGKNRVVALEHDWQKSCRCFGARLAKIVSLLWSTTGKNILFNLTFKIENNIICIVDEAFCKIIEEFLKKKQYLLRNI
jgi:hypothetical protein